MTFGRAADLVKKAKTKSSAAATTLRHVAAELPGMGVLNRPVELQ